jgi:hypothetical protein
MELVDHSQVKATDVEVSLEDKGAKSKFGKKKKTKK